MAATESGERFEILLARLEELVGKLESEELDLESSLGAFEDGVRIARECHRRLDAAERKIQILRQSPPAPGPENLEDAASRTGPEDA